MVQLLHIHIELIHPQSGALAHGGQLGGLAVGVGEAGHVLVLGGELRQIGNDADELFAHQFKALPHDDDIGVVAHIAAGSAQMDDALRLGALQAVGVDMAHHIMTHQLFPCGGVLVVDIVLVGLQLGDLLIGDVQTLFLLGLGQRDPQPPPGAELVVIGEDVLHLVRGIPGGKRRNITVMFSHDRLLTV